MDPNYPTSEQARIEKGTQTEASYLAAISECELSDNRHEDGSSGSPTDGSAGDSDIEKLNRYYDKETLLVNWSDSDDPVCQRILKLNLRLHLTLIQENPRNFSAVRKWIITVMLGIMTFAVTFASSVFSTATIATAKEFNVSGEVMVLGTSLFVLGFAFRPIIFGPLSELYGRRAPLFAGMFAFAVMQIPVAVAQAARTIFITRFLGGLFASAPLAIVSSTVLAQCFSFNDGQNGGMLADMFDPVDRGIAVAVFAACTFIGPSMGPILGGFITMSYLGSECRSFCKSTMLIFDRWRWTEYITMIMAFFFWIVAWIIIPETYPPVLLEWRAKRLRHKTKIWGIHAKAEENAIDMKTIAEKYLLRPFQMLVLEPILVLITLYMGFIYGFLYLSFMAYPIAFQDLRGWNPGVGALPFLAITIGVMIGCLIIVYFSNTRFQSVMEKTGHVVPEERLIPMMIGGVLLPGGMFWFGWTSSPHITWVPEVISGGFLGAGILLIFLQVGIPSVQTHLPDTDKPRD